MKTVILIFIIPLLIVPAYAQVDYLEVSPSNIGTLEVGIATIPENPTAGEVVKFRIDFINPKTDKIQEHIDYRFELQKNGHNVFGPIPLTHTSTGSVTIPVEITEGGTYSAFVKFEGILFQPIPEEVVSFSIPIAEGQQSGSNAQPPTGEGGGCLIATATFGSELASQVQQLREIRDDVVLNTKSGMAFMTEFNKFYYTISPTIADYERQNPIFKEFVKNIITPLLASLSILNYVEVDSDQDMLVYGISLILLNSGLYFGLPAFAIIKWYKLQTRNKHHF